MHGNGSGSAFGADVKEIEESIIAVDWDVDDVEAGSVLCIWKII